MGQELKKILVVRNDRFGEFLLNIPALRALKDAFPGVWIIAVVDPAVKELAGCISFIDEIIEWAPKGHSLSAKFRLVGSLKKKDIDAAVMFCPSKDFNLFTYLAGIPVRAGYDRKLGFLLTHKIEDRKHLAQKHEVEYNLELAGLIGAGAADTALSLSVPDTADNKIGNYLSAGERVNLVALHPWTSDPVKEWPLKNFSELAERLLKEPDIKVVVVGARQDSGRSAQAFAGLGENLIDLTGKTTLVQLALVLKKCRLLISADSGPVHLSSAVGTPVIALFRNDLPGKGPVRWGPRGSGHIVIEKSSLHDISVDEVFIRARQALAGR